MNLSDELRVLATASPAGLAIATSNEFRLPPHLDLLDGKLTAAALRAIDLGNDEQARGRQGPRLIVAMPPRHGKSLLTSRYFPAWFLGRFPEKRVIVTSYQEGLASGWGRQARELLQEHGQGLYGIGIRQDSRAASRWETSGGGGMVAAGVGGAITGRGADLFIIDDPLKDAEQAQSPLIRQKQKDWWQSTGRTRLMPGAAVVIVMTRWHEDDLAGWLLAQAEQDPDADQWEVISLPALAEPGDALGRPEGAALWPAQYDTEYLEGARRSSGTFWFAAMYQQRPAPAEGGLFKRQHFRTFSRPDDVSYLLHPPEGPAVRVPAERCRIFQTADTAATAKTESDYTAVITWALTPDNDLLVLHVAREQIEAVDVPAFIRAEHDAWNPIAVGIEDATYGLVAVQHLIRDGLPIRRLKADRDKVSRAIPAAVRYENGKVWHLRAAAWRGPLEDELANFPNAAHDDQADAVAYGIRMTDQLSAAAGPSRLPARGHEPVTAGLSTDDV